jgi:type II secretory pathway pseudopilin PulG
MTRSDDRVGGFTIIEMLVATMVMVAVTGAVFTLLNPAQGINQAQPEVSDLQQRMRVGVDTLTKDLIMAGAGSYMGSSAGALYNYFAPILPYRDGDLNPDPPNLFYRSDTLSLTYVPPSPAQTGVVQNLGNGNSQELVVQPQPNCGLDQHDQLCGFKDGMRALIYDVDGSWDTTTITTVQDEALHLQHSNKLSSAYDSGTAILTEVATHTYYLKTDIATNTYQLMHYDGIQTDLPVVDNVVKLTFSYFGDPQPPMLIPGKSLCDANVKGPFTTYGPRPPCIGLAPKGTYPSGENCAFTVANGLQVPRLPALAATTGEVELTQAMLTDGPWCPDPTFDNRYDADLLRIRRVGVTLRVQAAIAALRGPAGLLFTRGGTSTSAQRYVPDQEIKFSVTPRNMTLGR